MVRCSDSDKVTVVGVGVTLHEALSAYEDLKKEGINIRVVDPFTLKPIDKDLLAKCAKETGGRVLTVEDHYPEGTFAGNADCEAIGSVQYSFLARTSSIQWCKVRDQSVLVV